MSTPSLADCSEHRRKMRAALSPVARCGARRRSSILSANASSPPMTTGWSVISISLLSSPNEQTPTTLSQTSGAVHVDFSERTWKMKFPRL